MFIIQNLEDRKYKENLKVSIIQPLSDNYY